MQSGADILPRTDLASSPDGLAEPCAVIRGYRNPKNGYVLFTMDGVRDYAHRQSHRHFIGPIPDGFEVDHLCRNRACVEPTHLEAVTPLVNKQRTLTATKSECDHGHAFIPTNTYVRPNGTRACMTCRRDRARAAYALRIAA